MDATQIREQINKLGADMQAMLATAKTEKRELTKDEEGTFDKMDADREGLLATERRLTKVEEIEKGIGRRSNPVPPSGTPPREEQRDRRMVEHDRLLALQGWMLGGKAEYRTRERTEAASRLKFSLERNEINFRLAPVALRPTGPRGVTPQDIREWEERVIVGIVSPDGGGHFTVPDEAMRSLEIALLQFGGMRQVGTVIRTQTGADLPFPTTNDTANKGAIVAETVTSTELDVTFSQMVLQSFKYSSRMIFVSIEYLQDNAVNAAATIGNLLGIRLGRIHNDHFTTGTGSGQPNGIVTAATDSGFTAATSSTLSYDNIMDLKHSVDPAYRNGARFMFNDAVLKLLKKIKVPQFSGDTAGYPLWRPGFSTGEPDTIDGDPYTINQSMAAPSGTNRALVYGQLSKYMIRDVMDITLLRLDERYAELGQVAFLAFSRNDGDLLDAGTHPVKYLKMS